MRFSVRINEQRGGCLAVHHCIIEYDTRYVSFFFLIFSTTHPCNAAVLST